MKLLIKQGGRRCSRAGAFSLVEMLVSMTVVLLVLAGVLGTYLYGLRTVEFVKPKLGASDEARRAISLLLHEVRSAHLLRIGSGSLSTFTEVPPNTPQTGSAIQIHPSTNLNDFVRYFWDANERKLKRTTDGTTAVQIVANSVSNQMVFSAEDFAGRTLTNNYNNRVIGLTLQFYQIQFPMTAVGPGNFYDFYQIRTKITRRNIL
ncbi:MAG TPA: prepilin-type N-terminal cleavage/methylation domain-containing protein [Methylomirabilota bacterium]|nr:prepilin-type N-terminal cleavage/methylation domain-containing protein [Methylomirabilota bacterium]